MPIVTTGVIPCNVQGPLFQILDPPLLKNPPLRKVVVVVVVSGVVHGCLLSGLCFYSAPFQAKITLKLQCVWRTTVVHIGTSECVPHTILSRHAHRMCV